MSKNNAIKHFCAAVAAVGIWTGAALQTDAAVTLQTDGVGYIRPTLLGSNFKPQHLNNLISAHNALPVDPSDMYYPLDSASVPDFLPLVTDTSWYDPNPGGVQTWVSKTVNPINNAAQVTVNLGSGGFLYFIAQWDGPQGANAVYYVGGKSGLVTFENDLGNYFTGNPDPSQLGISHFYTVPAPVPEPSTVIAGALLLLPFGLSTLRVLRKRAS